MLAAVRLGEMERFQNRYVTSNRGREEAPLNNNRCREEYEKALPLLR
jgi:hypothetical protein